MQTVCLKMAAAQKVVHKKFTPADPEITSLDSLL
jgi:hypothetical protein